MLASSVVVAPEVALSDTVDVVAVSDVVVVVAASLVVASFVVDADSPVVKVVAASVEVTVSVDASVVDAA